MTFHNMNLIAAAVFVLSACASTTAVMHVAKHTYEVSAEASPGQSEATGAVTNAFNKADSFCARKGMHAMVVDTKVKRSAVFGDGYSIRFQCTPNN